MPRTDPQAQPKPRRFWRLSRWPITLATALVLALTPMIYPASPATAASIVAECHGTFARTFSPPIAPTPQTITVTGTNDYTTCPVGPTATGTETTTLILSCVPVTAAPETTETLTWHDATGGTSTITWSAPTIVAQTVVFTGTVTAGRHAGDTATKITSGVSYLGSVLSCQLSGTPISSTTGLVDSLLLTY